MNFMLTDASSIIGTMILGSVYSDLHLRLNVSFQRISLENGRWRDLLVAWEAECSTYGENLEDYAVASLPTVKPLAEGVQTNSAGVYGLEGESGYMALCQLNVGFIPGYRDKVLRVRHSIFAPRFDFDNTVTFQEYVNVIADLLTGVLAVSDAEMVAPNVKFHFRSPAEREFFQAFREAAEARGAFGDIQMKGAWLYIEKLKA